MGEMRCSRRPLSVYQKKGKQILGRQNIQCPLQATPRISCVKKALSLSLNKLIMILMPRGMLILLQKNCFQVAALTLISLLIIIIFIKAGAQKLSTWQHIVNGLSYCTWLGAFKVIFLAEYLINNLKQLGANSTLMEFCCISTTFHSFIL